MKRVIIPILLMGGAVLLTSCATKNHSRTANGQNYSATTGPGVTQSVNEWPMVFTEGTTTYTVFEPQCDSWDGHQFTGRSAVAVQPASQSQATYGVVTFSAITLVNKSAHTARLASFRATSADFPSARDQTQNFLASIVQNFPKHAPALALDEMQNSMAAPQVPKNDRLNNTPPKIIVATKPSVLVYLDGPEALRPVAGTDLQRVINTRMLLLKDHSGKYYLHLFDGYVEAPSLEGPWTVASQPPTGATAAEQLAAGQADLMQGTPDAATQKIPTLKTPPTPDVIVSSHPAELIQLRGQPQFAPIPGTHLLYAENTSGNVFKSTSDQQTYVLISGRWYRAATLDGPWQFVPGNELPHDFASIPDSSPKENVKASVPGTPQAEEALIANSIPESTAVPLTNQMAPPQIDGTMQLAAIEGTPLHYVVNSPTPIIELTPQSWYACQDGVWYSSTSATGPWTAATFVPPVIYTIPPDSPLHYVTYVKIYGAGPQTVYEGYTPGYMGTEVAEDGTVVYGTGYVYDPWIGTVWYGPPVTWGWGFYDCWSPWWGWGYGCGFGWGWGWDWGFSPPYPWWCGFHHFHDFDRGFDRHFDHDFAWRGNRWANTSASVYHPQSQFGGNRAQLAQHGDVIGAGQAYNSRTGWLQSGQHARVMNVSGAAWNTAHQVNYAGRNYNYSRSYTSPRFGDMNRGYQTYPRGSWQGGNNFGAYPGFRGMSQGQGGGIPGAMPRGGGGMIHGGGGGGGGGGHSGGGGGGGGGHGGGGGGGGHR